MVLKLKSYFSIYFEEKNKKMTIEKYLDDFSQYYFV